MSARRFLPPLALLLSLLTPSLARAQSEDADDEMRRGIALRRDRRDEEALGAFRHANAIAPSARAQAQIALAEQALDRFVDAERDLQGALGSDDAWIAQHREALTQSLREIAAHLATIDVSANVDGVEVLIDGAHASTLPGPASRVVAGRHVIEVRATDGARQERAVSVAAGERLEAVFVFAAPRIVTREVRATEAPAPPDGSAQRRLGWTFAIGSGVMLAGSVAGFAYAADRSARYNGDACADMPGATRSDRCGDVRAQFETSRTLATGALGIAIAGGAAAAVLLFTSPRGLSAPGPHVACGAAGAGITCSGAF